MSNSPGERQRSPPETSPAFSGGSQPHPSPQSGKSQPTQVKKCSSTIRRGVRGDGSKGESVVSPTGSEALHGKYWSIAATPDGGLTTSVYRNTGEV